MTPQHAKGLLSTLENNIAKFEKENGKIPLVTPDIDKSSIGFQTEVISSDFYDDGEDQLILGLDLRTDDDEQADDDLKVQEEKPVMRFNGLYEIADTEGAYTFSWVVQDSIKLFGKRSFSAEDLSLGLQSVKEAGGRRVFLTFPSNLPLIHKPLQAAGFKYVGQLTDYYERGVHEFHFTHDLGDLQD